MFPNICSESKSVGPCPGIFSYAACGNDSSLKDFDKRISALSAYFKAPIDTLGDYAVLSVESESTAPVLYVLDRFTNISATENVAFYKHFEMGDIFETSG